MFGLTRLKRALPWNGNTREKSQMSISAAKIAHDAIYIPAKTKFDLAQAEFDANVKRANEAAVAIYKQRMTD